MLADPQCAVARCSRRGRRTARLPADVRPDNPNRHEWPIRERSERDPTCGEMPLALGALVSDRVLALSFGEPRAAGFARERPSTRPMPQPGHFAGTTSQQGTISFDVSERDSQVSNIMLSVTARAAQAERPVVVVRIVRRRQPQLFRSARRPVAGHGLRFGHHRHDRGLSQRLGDPRRPLRGRRLWSAGTLAAGPVSWHAQNTS